MMQRLGMGLLACLLVLSGVGQAGAADRPIAISGGGIGSGFDEGRLTAEMIPAGPVELGGTRWRLSAEDAVRIGPDSKPAEVEFDRPTRVDELAFLHTFDPGEGVDDYRLEVATAHRTLELPPEPPVVLRYRVKYADGETVEIPVRFGESIEETYRVHGVGPMLWAQPALVRELDGKSGEKAVAYAMTWPNPRPKVAVESVELMPAEGVSPWGEGLVLAVSAKADRRGGRQIYVAPPPIGSDDQPGSFQEPLGTLGRAAEMARAGDTVFVRGGYYALNEPVQIENSGREGAWLTFTAYPGETPVFDAFGVQYDYRTQPYDPEGPRPAGPAYQHDQGAIQAHHENNYLRIRGLQVQNSRRAGISVYGPGHTDHIRAVDVSFNRIDRCFSMGIIPHAVDELTVIGNVVCRPHSLQMAIDPITREKMVHSELPQEGIDLSRNDGFEVAWNVVYGGGKEAIDLISVSDGTVHHNYVHSSLNGIYIDSWSVPITGVDVHHNYIHNAYNGIPLATEGSNALADIQIHRNIVFDTKSGGIGVAEATYKAQPAPVHDIAVFQNTVHHAGYHAKAIGWLATGIQVHGFEGNEQFRDIEVLDNIVTDSAQVPIVSTLPLEKHDIRIAHNLVHPAEQRLTDWMREKESERRIELDLGTPVVTKPAEYVAPERGDFRLREGSPAIGAASDGGDIGALPHGSAWRPGFDWAGQVTAQYRGEKRYEPVYIPNDKFTMHRNHLERPSWFQTGRYGADFQHLPGGEQAIGGVVWYIEQDDASRQPTVLSLRGHANEVEATEVTDIPVGRKADTLAFLHVYHKGPRLGGGAPKLLHYQVNYADGESVEVPVRWNRQIGDWQSRGQEPPAEAKVVWRQRVSNLGGRDQGYIRLLSYEWENPRPSVKIKSIDVVSDVERLVGAPAVFAISTGHKQ
ncbi:MAG: right-handed parallel beta-helix repeat-containing protein [Phycisphaeraceae bacterium]